MRIAAARDKRSRYDQIATMAKGGRGRPLQGLLRLIDALQRYDIRDSGRRVRRLFFAFASIASLGGLLVGLLLPVDSEAANALARPRAEAPMKLLTQAPAELLTQRPAHSLTWPPVERPPEAHGTPLLLAVAILPPPISPSNAILRIPDGRQVVVASGDTLMNILTRAGAARPQAHAAITALSPVWDPRQLKPGQALQILFSHPSAELLQPVSTEEAAAAAELLGLRFRPDLSQDVEVLRDDDGGFQARALARELTLTRQTAAGDIDLSLMAAGQEAGVPANILFEAIRTFSFDVDFQREIQKGDRFEFFYETFVDPDGQIARPGNMLYAALTLSGEEIAYYHFEEADGNSDYYNAKGQSVRKALLRTPIDGARISSGYGKRKHPISGYNKMHRGVDFAAPRGTPIYAAGKGKVEVAGRNGGYGKYVRIRHNGTYKTAYAHMKGIAKGIKAGKWVKQGQVIGYVGSTGKSTGPHLHYEIHKSGKQTNPLKVRLPSGEKLSGDRLAAFQARRDEIKALRRQQTPTDAQIVQAH